jgi:hypothetical protein
VKSDEEAKIKYFAQSPISKADHPVRKVAAAAAAGQEITSSPQPT